MTIHTIDIFVGRPFPSVVAVLAFLVFGNAVAAEQKLPFLGDAGATQCTKWQAHHNNNQDTNNPILGLKDWILGFISGMNFLNVVNARDITPGNVSNFLAEITEDEVFTRMDNYCREHPSDSLFNAASSISADLMDAAANAIRNR